MIATVIIGPDPVGQNVKRFLLREKISFNEVTEKTIFCENLDKNVNGEVFIFVTTHKSSANVPSLTVHPIGNWGKADLGGRDQTIVPAPAALIKQLYLSMKKHYSGTVTLEVTHHGPFLEKPTCFLEIGSSENEWNNPQLGELLVSVLKEVLQQEEKKFPVIFGLGGGHYPHEFNKIIERTSYAVGHICPKYQLQNLDETMLLQVIKNNVDCVVLDWKGLGREKQKIKSLLEKLNIKYKRTEDIKEIS